MRLRHHAVCKLVPLQFKDQRATVQIQLTFQLRMNNPNKTNTFTFQINRRRLARMKRIIGFDAEFDVGQLTGEVEDRLQIAFKS